MFEFRRLYCAHAKLHAPFPFDGLLQSTICLGWLKWHLAAVSSPAVKGKWN